MIYAAIAVAITIVATGCRQDKAAQGFLNPTSAQAATTRVSTADAARAKKAPLLYEIPAKLTDRPEQIIKRKGYTTSYNSKTKTPNWVAWHLTKQRTYGSAMRSGMLFTEDTAVEAPRATDKDYYNSRYDRGHMCPAGDMKWSQEAMTDCHYMTNICPQTAELNKTWWEHLERACRRWARRDGAVQIVCGPIFSENPKRFGKKHKVAVPRAFYKVVLSLKKGREKAIGFFYTNDDAIQPMEDAVRSVDDIERLTGLDFFSSLPDEQEDKLEAMNDLKIWDE